MGTILRSSSKCLIRFFSHLSLGKTEEAVRKDERIRGDIDFKKGVLTFRFNNCSVQISPRGIVSVYFNHDTDLFKIYEKLRKICRTSDNKKALLMGYEYQLSRKLKARKEFYVDSRKRNVFYFLPSPRVKKEDKIFVRNALTVENLMGFPEYFNLRDETQRYLCLSSFKKYGVIKPDEMHTLSKLEKRVREFLNLIGKKRIKNNKWRERVEKFIKHLPTTLE